MQEGNAPTAAGRQRPPPAGLLRGELEDRFGAWRLFEQGPAVLERVLLRDRGELVDEALDHEDVVRGPYAAPECGRNSRRLLADVLDADVGECIGWLGRAVHGIHIEASHHSDEVVEACCAHHPYGFGEEFAGN